MSLATSPFFLKLLVVLMLLSTFLYKPTTIGINYTPIGMILSLLCCLLFISISKGRQVTLSKKNIALMAAITLYFSYACFQSVILLGWFDINLLKAYFSIICLVLCSSILFQNKLIEYYFFKSFITILVLFVVSNIFTIVLAKIFTLDRVLLADIPMMDDGYRLILYYPFTAVYGRLTISGDVIMRLTALFREPGIAQAFYVWALVICGQYFSSKYIKILLILGVFMTLSTVGFLNLMVVISLVTIFTINFKRLRSYASLIISLSLLVGAFTFFSSVPGLSLESKSSISYDARVGKLDEGIEEFYNAPIFGLGASDLYIEGTATSFLQQAYAVGTVGIILYISIFFVGLIYERRNWKVFFLSYLSIMITLLFSQPIELSPLVMLPLLVDFKNKYLKSKLTDT